MTKCNIILLGLAIFAIIATLAACTTTTITNERSVCRQTEANLSDSGIDPYEKTVICNNITQEWSETNVSTQ